MPTNPPRPLLDKIMRAVATLIRIADFDEQGDARKTIAMDAKDAAWEMQQTVEALRAENERLRSHAEELQVALDEATGGGKE